jgi:hypothetical protein
MERFPTTEKARKTIALKVGACEIGYAVLRGNELLLFGVRRLARGGGRPGATDRRFLGNLFDGFDPDLCVLERLTVRAKKKAALRIRISAVLAELARGRKVRVRTYGLRTVREVVTRDPAATKAQVAAVIVQWFPYLDRYLRTDLRTRRVYWMKMLEAVALGVTANEELTKAVVMAALRRQGSSRATVV